MTPTSAALRAGIVLAIAGAAFALGYCVRGAGREAIMAPANVAAGSPSTSTDSSESPSAAPPSAAASSPIVEPVESGRHEIDRARLKALEARAARERSIDESVELARGHRQLGLLDVAELDAMLDAKGLADLRTLARLREDAKDDALAIDVLAVVARHPSRVTADLLYDVRVDPHSSDDVRYLAEDLLAIAAVRTEASKELSVALDLASARGCEAARLVVERAKTTGDERATPGLRLLDDKSGCGPKRDEDCYPCLREGTLLYEAHDAVAGRHFAPPWRLTPR